jgi:hypothetical protein
MCATQAISARGNVLTAQKDARFKLMAKGKPKKTGVLSDHTRVGKKFFPPAARFGWTEVHYIERILPEIAWMGFFLERFGTSGGVEILENFLRICYSIKPSAAKFFFCSAFRAVTTQEWSGIRKRCRGKGIFLEVLDALTPFLRCYPQSNPIEQFFEETPDAKNASASDIDRARTVVSNLFDRRSQSASVVQSVIPKIEIEIGKYHVPENYPFLDFESIITTFDSEHTSSLCSHVRMHVNGSFMMYESQISDSWARYFWNRGRDLAPLNADNVDTEDLREPVHPVIKFGIDYEKYAWGVVDAIWRKFPVDIFESEVSEVIGALLAHQCNLAVKVACNPDLWDYHAGPLFLRSMTDTYITAAWILKDPLVRAREFIQYGLGQEKLQVERLKAAIETEQPGDSELLRQGIEARQAWIDGQHYSFLQHVDIGSWSGMSARKMAVEADCLDLYDFAYTGWSHGVHGTWNHIGKFDAFPSADPLHKHILQPANVPHGQHLDVVEKATKYFDKLAVHLVDAFKIEMAVPRPTEWLGQRIGKLEQEMDARDSQQGGESGEQTSKEKAEPGSA